MKNTLNKLTQIRDDVTNVAHQIESLSRAFYATGNEQVANKLGFMAEDLMAVVEDSHKAWNADMDEQMCHSQAMMGSILSLALNCDIKPRKDAE